MISAVVISKNEEKNIAHCLESLKWCDEIIVIDDFSSDKTLEIAQHYGVKIFKRHVDNDFAKQRNFGLEEAKEKWVLFVDADEEVSEKLQKEIREAILSTQINGYCLKRKDCFLGMWLKHGETRSVHLLRLARKGSGLWRRRVDEVWETSGEKRTLASPLRHFSHTNLSEFLKSINQYSSLNARELYEENKKVSFLDWFKPIFKFLQNYFLRLGFLDGIPGFLMAILMSFHSFLVRGKLYLTWKNEGGWHDN